ncbi:hypothetical protein GmHk_16G045656 [Glycine max]|uniref:DUF639 domain-containing protein n=2 Tax=Glycine soja TaxID=3848 RepID=A0A445GDX9_GLYSO|nr:uncharacterized protein LOC114389574 isoform X1 [Glycine soja]KAH1149845.1 hypothetical protein GYH30_044056 [Glycine max]KAH1204789.1 hypothetical protein GmHk_16G045656 [Glycine max]KAH1204790.1 hypothetical protein GmHk_16G045656 [Glycine max]RZB59457.1 hypothetical protein D0Y65_042620 [Glycine soja]
MAMKLKYLSSIAEDVIKRCSQKLDTSVEKLVEDFEGGWNPEMGNYCRKLVEFCSGKGVNEMCHNIEGNINDSSFSRLTYDMMLAWERPSYYDEEPMETVAKEKEERKITLNTTQELDDIPLFYSDIMPLLVNNEPNVGEDAFVWLGSLVPLVADVSNGRFTFESLTAPTGNRLHFPAYDMFLKEMDKCIRHLQKHATPNGVELAEDEYILHVDGTASTQRVVRHIGTTSWPGRLTLTNYSLYFEASGVIRYEDALKIDLSKNVEQSVKPAATGPWGAQLYDKAIIYDSTDLSETVVLEFPELTSSTRRDHWLALVREIMFLHQFLSKNQINCLIQTWELHSRTILGIVRLHAAREMLRISPPVPTKFLIFSLYNEIPKGDYVLEELADSLKKGNNGQSCSASSILRSMNISKSVDSDIIIDEASQADGSVNVVDDSPSLEAAIKQSREEEKEILIAKATTDELKEEGVTDSVLVITELLKPLKNAVPWFQEIFTWERPIITLAVLAASLMITYMEWVGKTFAVFLIWAIIKMLDARQKKIHDKSNEIVISRSSMASDQSTMESIVSAQHGLYTVHDMMQIANIAMLKIWSILISKADKHANLVMVAMSGLAILLAVIPFKFFLMALILQSFTMTLGKSSGSGTGNRRLREWWDSIPIVPIRVVDDPNTVDAK